MIFLGGGGGRATERGYTVAAVQEWYLGWRCRVEGEAEGRERGRSKITRKALEFIR